MGWTTTADADGATTGVLTAAVGAAAAALVAAATGVVPAAPVALVIGAVVARSPLAEQAAPGLDIACRTLLRAAVVLLGFRLSWDHVSALGLRMAAVVVAVVVITFVATRAVGRALGVGEGVSAGVAIAFAVCGASAVAAARDVLDLDDDDVSFTVALVALCGSLAIAVIPLLGAVLGLGHVATGRWIGAGVHDVGQVVAAATAVGPAAVEAAVVVKVARVGVLAPLLMVLAAVESRRQGTSPRAGARVPRFLFGFVVAVAATTILPVPDAVLAAIGSVERALLLAAFVGVGAGVRFDALRRVGPRPVALALVSWTTVAGVSLVGVVAVGP